MKNLFNLCNDAFSWRENCRKYYWWKFKGELIGKIMCVCGIHTVDSDEFHGTNCWRLFFFVVFSAILKILKMFLFDSNFFFFLIILEKDLELNLCCHSRSFPRTKTKIEQLKKTEIRNTKVLRPKSITASSLVSTRKN